MAREIPLTNYHTHCFYCDGAGNPEDYVDEAKKRGFTALGFSSHAPLPIPVDWLMDEGDLEKYCNHIRSLKDLHRQKLQIYLGLEIDFVPGISGPRSSRFTGLGLDYTFGSIHFLKLEKDVQYTVDGPPEEFAEALDKEFSGNAARLVSKYYKYMRQMVTEQAPDIVGHFDVVKKNNSNNRFFDTGESWYKNEVIETIEAISGTDAVLEINTGALARGHKDVIYPEPWIVRECFNRDIRMSINSDAHNAAYIDFAFDRARKIMLDAGYEEQWVLLDDTWQGVPLI